MTLTSYEPEQWAQPEPARDLPEWVARIEPATKLAAVVAHTDFVPKALRGNEPAIAACIMYGLEIGIGPMQALQSIHVIDGRPQPSSELMRALVQAAGHEIWTVASDRTKATVRGRRKGQSAVVEFTYTTEDAKLAGLLYRDNWKKHPRAMLLARAYGLMCRDHFAAETRGLTTDEPSLAELAAEGGTEPSSGSEGSGGSSTARRVRRKPPEPVEAAHGPATAGFGPSRPAEPSPAEPVPESDLEAAQRVAREAGLLPPEAKPLGMDTQERIDHIPVAETGEKITDAQLKKMNAALRDIGITSRPVKLMFCTAVLGREIDSSGKLTKSEASQVIERIADVEAGLVELDDLLGEPL